MSVIKPFRAIRPVPEMAEKVACVPYDVVSVPEAREMITENPLSFLRVTRPEAVPDVTATTANGLNSAARENLEKMIADGVFVTENEESVYIYRLQAAGHVQTGVVACCSIDEYESGALKRHEKTRPDKVADRTDHMLELQAQTGLIFLAYRGTTRLRMLIEEETAHEPLFDFPCRTTGVQQTIWKTVRPQEFVDAFAEVPAIYIADGHHRAESAARARATLKQQDPGSSGHEEYNFVVAGIFPAEDLKILPYNRVVRDLNGLAVDDFLARISDSFVLEATGEKVPKEAGRICMYLGGEWRSLRFSVNFVRAPDAIESLDVSILQDYLLAPVLGIGDPRTDDRIAFVGGIRGTDELEMLVDTGKAQVAFSMFPTSMSDLFAVSDMDAIMPPKSTWFEPKLKDGLLIHAI